MLILEKTSSDVEAASTISVAPSKKAVDGEIKDDKDKTKDKDQGKDDDLEAPTIHSLFRVALVNTSLGAGLVYHPHKVEGNDARLSYQMTVAFNNVSSNVLHNPMFYAFLLSLMLGMDVRRNPIYKNAHGFSNQRLQASASAAPLYSQLLPLLNNCSLTDSLGSLFRIDSNDADDVNKVTRAGDADYMYEDQDEENEEKEEVKEEVKVPDQTKESLTKDLTSNSSSGSSSSSSQRFISDPSLPYTPIYVSNMAAFHVLVQTTQYLMRRKGLREDEIALVDLAVRSECLYMCYNDMEILANFQGGITENDQKSLKIVAQSMAQSVMNAHEHLKELNDKMADSEIVKLTVDHLSILHKMVRVLQAKANYHTQDPNIQSALLMGEDATSTALKSSDEKDQDDGRYSLSHLSKHPLFTRFLRVENVDGLAGLRIQPPKYLPIDFNLIPKKIRRFEDILTTLRNTSKILSLLSCQSRGMGLSLVKNAPFHKLALITHVFCSLLPIPYAFNDDVFFEDVNTDLYTYLFTKGGMKLPVTHQSSTNNKGPSASDWDATNANQHVDDAYEYNDDFYFTQHRKVIDIWATPLTYSAQLDTVLLLGNIMTHFAASSLSIYANKYIDALKITVPFVIMSMVDATLRRFNINIASDRRHTSPFHGPDGPEAQSSSSTPSTKTNNSSSSTNSGSVTEKNNRIGRGYIDVDMSTSDLGRALLQTKYAISTGFLTQQATTTYVYDPQLNVARYVYYL